MTTSGHDFDATLQRLASRPEVSDILVKEDDSVWVRADGALQRTDLPAASRKAIVDFLAEHEAHTAVPAARLDELLNKRGDLDFALSVAGTRFRGNLYRTNGKRLALAFRKLPNTVPMLASLNLPPAWPMLINRSKGLLLVTGGTGSGKSTTMAATVNQFNSTREGHIITLEDPVEYQMASKTCLIDQRQVGPDVKDFATGLRAALREDPDIILIGELRDAETVRTALDAANTGHLVLGSLHTMNARQSVERITSFYEADERDWAQAMFAQVLIGTLSQVLVPRADKKGRVLAAELMVNTSSVRSAIKEGKANQIFNAMDTGMADGHQLLNLSLAKFVRQGVITAQDAAYYAYDPAGLAKELGHA